MNDQSKPQTAQEWADSAPSTAGDADDPRNDPEYQESLHDTQVTQRLVDKLEEMYADAGEEDCEILKQTLADLRMAYEAIRPDNDWALDIS